MGYISTFGLYKKMTDRMTIDAISHVSKSLLDYSIQSIKERQIAIESLLVVDVRKAFETYSIIEANRRHEFNELELSDSLDNVVNAVNVLRDFERAHGMQPIKIDGIDGMGFPISHYFE
jgi:hypothetical protein